MIRDFANKQIKVIKYSHNTEGIKQTQLVNMAPFTTSNSGKTTKKRSVNPIMCIVSNTRTTKKSEKEDLRQDLKTQILADLNAVPEILRHFSLTPACCNDCLLDHLKTKL